MDRTEEGLMLYVIAGILLLAWLFGFGVFHVGTALIHLVLVAALIVAAVERMRGRRPV
jgi:hypothetical protein